MEMRAKGMQKRGYIAIAAIAAVVIVALVLVLVLKGKEDSYRSIKIIELQGGVTIEREGVGALEASANMNLISGDAVQTEQGAYAVLQLDSDKYVMLAESGSMTVVAEGSEKNGRTTIQLEAGSVLNEIQNPLSNDSSYDIVTPNATMSVRGTVFEVRRNESGSAGDMELLVYDGMVMVNLDDVAPALYKAGEYTQFTAGEKPQFIIERAEIAEGQLNPQFIERLELINSQSRELNLGTAQLDSEQTQGRETDALQTAAPAQTMEPQQTPVPTETPAQSAAPEQTPTPSPVAPAATQAPVRTPKPQTGNNASNATVPSTSTTTNPDAEDEEQEDDQDTGDQNTGDQAGAESSGNTQQPGENSGNNGNGDNAGDSGNTGDAGNIGDSGNAGDAGNAGDSGNTGDAGNAGDSGNAGDAGNTGDSGNTGDAGNAGDSGNTGDAGNAGDSGNAGDAGNAGDSGNAGDAEDGEIVGDSGNADDKEYAGGSESGDDVGIIEDNGNTGDGENTGDEGSTGDSGNTGDEGSTGDSGNTGDEGNTGDSGNAGDEGNTGDSGNAGDEGNTGDSGNTGDEGNTGDSGNTGDNGDTGNKPCHWPWEDIWNFFGRQNAWKAYTAAAYQQAVSANVAEGTECTVVYYLPYIAEAEERSEGIYSMLRNDSPDVYSSTQTTVGSLLTEPETPVGKIDHKEELPLNFVGWCLEDGTMWRFDLDTVKANMCLYPVWSDEQGMFYYPVICRSAEVWCYYCNSIKEGSRLGGLSLSNSWNAVFQGWERVNKGNEMWNIETDVVEGFVESLKASWSN